MSEALSTDSSSVLFLPRSEFAGLVRELRALHYTVIAPQRREDVIRLAPLGDTDEIARGVRDEQSGGRYRLVPSEPGLYFEYVVGPDSPKRYLFPPQQDLFKLLVKSDGFQVEHLTPPAPKLAFLGIRSCELAAIQIQDRVFGSAPGRTATGVDAFYQQTRAAALFITVDCTRPGGTCFCDSMGTGTQAHSGFDMAMTELRSGFVIRVGSPRGRELLARLPVREPLAVELELVELKIRQAREHMGRKLDNRQAIEVLRVTTEHPRFEDVAKRCLSCGNCTMVCPTCFCSTVTDATSLANGASTRTRRWESCFTHQFSHTTPGPVRNTIRGRYRHWLRHKLCTWWEQFETSGCVGCGRCITWCPVGIDLTEEVKAIAGSLRQPPAAAPVKGGA